MRIISVVCMSLYLAACRPTSAKSVDEDPGRFVETWDITHEKESTCKIDFAFRGKQDSNLAGDIGIPENTFSQDGKCSTGPFNAVHVGDLKLPVGATLLEYPVFVKFTLGQSDELYDDGVFAGKPIKLELRFLLDRPAEHLYVLVVRNPGTNEERLVLDKKNFDYSQANPPVQDQTHVNFPIQHSYAIYAPFEYKDPLPSGFP